MKDLLAWTVLVVGGLAVFVLMVPRPGSPATVGAIEHVDQIRGGVASDAERLYERAKQKGRAADACAHAGFVASAYLQAENEPEHARWKQVERSDCAAAGVPR